MMRLDEYDGQLNIYCHDEVINATKNIYPHLFSNTSVELIDKY